MTVMENVMEDPLYVRKIPKAQAANRPWPCLPRSSCRISIARGLAMGPDVMLFDELTSALAPELVGEFLAVMRDLAAEGRTMLVVTHEMAFARDVSTETVFLEKGEVCESGPPAQLFANLQTDQFRAFMARMN